MPVEGIFDEIMSRTAAGSTTATVPMPYVYDDDTIIKGQYLNEGAHLDNSNLPEVMPSNFSVMPTGFVVPNEMNIYSAATGFQEPLVQSSTASAYPAFPGPGLLSHQPDAGNYHKSERYLHPLRSPQTTRRLDNVPPAFKKIQIIRAARVNRQSEYASLAGVELMFHPRYSATIFEASEDKYLTFSIGVAPNINWEFNGKEGYALADILETVFSHPGQLEYALTSLSDDGIIEPRPEPDQAVPIPRPMQDPIQHYTEKMEEVSNTRFQITNFDSVVPVKNWRDWERREGRRIIYISFEGHHVHFALNPPEEHNCECISIISWGGEPSITDFDQLRIVRQIANHSNTVAGSILFESYRTQKIEAEIARLSLLWCDDGTKRRVVSYVNPCAYDNKDFALALATENTVHRAWVIFRQYHKQESFKVVGDLGKVEKGWNKNEVDDCRRVVKISWRMEADSIELAFDVVTGAPSHQNDPGSVLVSCIWWQARGKAVITAQDFLNLLQPLFSVPFNENKRGAIREKLRRRFELIYLPHWGPEADPAFFDLITNFENPRARKTKGQLYVLCWDQVQEATRHVFATTVSFR